MRYHDDGKHVHVVVERERKVFALSYLSLVA